MPRFKDPDTGNELFWTFDTAYNILKSNTLKEKFFKP
jgi:hypothetical protein